jgi:hypothetical protein
MGCSASLFDTPLPNPKTVNRCSDGVGDILESTDTRICYAIIENTVGNGPGSSKRESDRYILDNFCASIGSENEWEAYEDNGSGCCTISGGRFKGVRLRDGEPCKGECDGNLVSGGLDGATLLGGFVAKNGDCIRKRFTANPEVCCFLDNDCATTDFDDPCFETPFKERTCDPKYRDLGASSCLEKIKPFCTGEEKFLGQQNWWDLWVKGISVDVNSSSSHQYVAGPSRFVNPDFNIDPNDEETKRFMEQPCLRALARAISRDDQFCTWDSIKSLDIRRGNYDVEGLKWAQDVVNAIFDRYIREYGTFIGGITGSGKQVPGMVDVFYEICQKFPVLCADPLRAVCENLTSEELVETPEADKWCGCYMPDVEYEKYTNQFGINRECTPFCNSENVIPLTDPDGYEIQCLTDICIIDNLRLNFIRNRGGNSANFSLLCGGCGGNNVNKEIGSDGNFNTSRDTIVGIYSNTIFDQEVCSMLSPTNPFAAIFNGGETVTVTMVGENQNEINVTLGLNVNGIGDSQLNQYSLVFVSASIIDSGYRFMNGEQLTIKNLTPPLSCNLFAITVDINYQDTDRTTKNLIRRKETVGGQCTCILDGSTISIVDSQFGNLNLVQNCGSNFCQDDDGNEIPCASNSIIDNDNYYPPPEAIHFTSEMAREKRYNLIALVMLGILILSFLVAIGVSIGRSNAGKTSVGKK